MNSNQSNLAETAREIPLLMSAPMVRAMISGHKTQTRRVIKGQPTAGVTGVSFEYGSGLQPRFVFYRSGQQPVIIKCRYGQPGDSIWIRETFLYIHSMQSVIFRADLVSVEAAGIGAMYGGWKPSIHLPRQHCRLTRKIADIRIEQLQDITEADARAEGFVSKQFEAANVIRFAAGREPVIDDAPSARDAFHGIWCDLNGQESWDANPFVAVIEWPND